jgi:predicted kinase
MDGYDARVGPNVYVIISGPPASGKTTLGRLLAEELGLPYMAKDTIKSALIAELGAVDVAASRRLGAAAMRSLVEVAIEAGRGVLDGSWLRDRTSEQVLRLPGHVVEVFCRCTQSVMEQRFHKRTATRGAGHFDNDRSWDELWGDQTSEPVGAAWPVIEVDSTQPVDVPALAHAVRQAMADAGNAWDNGSCRQQPPDR